MDTDMDMNEEEVEETKEEEKEKGSRLKIIIIVGIVVLVLTGVGAITYKKFLSESEATKESLNEVNKIQQIVTHQLDTFIVNLADPGGKRYLRLTIDLELDNPKVIEEIKQNNFKIRDAILLILSSKEFDDISTMGGKIILKKEIVAKLNSLLTTGQVLNVYFTEFLVQ